MRRIIGVTGLPCAGKSTAAHLLADGVGTGTPGVLIKADDVGHQVLERPEVLVELRRHFGAAVAEAGSPAEVRKAVAARVFANPADLAWLERLVHPLVRAEAESIIHAHPDMPAVVEAALLFTGGLGDLCDVVVLVEAHLDIRMVRAAARGWRSDELARREGRLLPLFAPDVLARYQGTLLRVRNDEDDGGLAGRLQAAFIQTG